MNTLCNLYCFVDLFRFIAFEIVNYHLGISPEQPEHVINDCQCISQ